MGTGRWPDLPPGGIAGAWWAELRSASRSSRRSAVLHSACCRCAERGVQGRIRASLVRSSLIATATSPAEVAAGMPCHGTTTSLLPRRSVRCQAVSMSLSGTCTTSKANSPDRAHVTTWPDTSCMLCGLSPLAAP